jgi:hypothetical protein
MLNKNAIYCLLPSLILGELVEGRGRRRKEEESHS